MSHDICHQRVCKLTLSQVRALKICTLSLLQGHIINLKIVCWSSVTELLEPGSGLNPEFGTYKNSFVFSNLLFPHWEEVANRFLRGSCPTSKPCFSSLPTSLNCHCLNQISIFSSCTDHSFPTGLPLLILHPTQSYLFTPAMASYQKYTPDSYST